MNDDPYTQSARLTGFLGWLDGERPDEADPAEAFHEASKNVPSIQPRVSPVAALLAADPTAGMPGATIARPVRRNLALPTVALPAPAYGDAEIGSAIGDRVSRRDFGSAPISLQQLSTLLHAAYGVTQEAQEGQEGRRVRSVPSGGGLYPLELFAVARNVGGVAAGLYHYDPLRHLLEVVRQEEVTDSLREILLELPQLPDIPATCGVVFFIAGVFWRTRFKYGLRGYRWILVEAGHVGQNMVLAAGSLGLHSFPNAGFWDRKVDAFLGLDGVNESVVYSLIAGSPADGAGHAPDPSFFS